MAGWGLWFLEVINVKKEKYHWEKEHGTLKNHESSDI
jgi:hypothetical protein